MAVVIDVIVPVGDVNVTIGIIITMRYYYSLLLYPFARRVLSLTR